MEEFRPIYILYKCICIIKFKKPGKLNYSIWDAFLGDQDINKSTEITMMKQDCIYLLGGVMIGGAVEGILGC